MRRNEGFTLVELLIVLAVIAALLATITPVALNAVKKAKASQVAQNLRNIRTAIEQYFYTEQTDLRTTVTEEDLFASLTGYLSEQPDSTKYKATISKFEGGEAHATIAYVGHDVDINMVNDSYPEAVPDSTNNEVYVTFTIAQYW